MSVVTLTGLALASIALCDPRARALVGVILIVWGVTWTADMSLAAQDSVPFRIPADLVGATLALAVIAVQRRYEAWAVSVPFFFALMLSAHFAYWFAYAQGVSLWVVYANGLNALFLAQLAVLAGPGGTRIANVFSRWTGASRSWGLAGFMSRRVVGGKEKAP